MKGSKVLLFFFIPVLILFAVGFVFGPLGTSFFGTKTPSFLQVPKPNVELPAEPVFHIGHFAVTNTLIASWLRSSYWLFWLLPSPVR